MKMSKQTKKFLILAVVAALLFFLYQRSKKVAGYKMHGADITIKTKTEQDLFALPYKLGCVPGSGEEGESTHTKGLTPGGMCGIQNVVRDYGSYEITGGIGMDDAPPVPMNVDNKMS
jgi:hypothetical protein